MEGFWEQNGAHARGRITEEEKLVPEAAAQWEEGMKMTNWYREKFGDRVYFYAMQFFGRQIGDLEFNRKEYEKIKISLPDSLCSYSITSCIIFS